MPAGSSAKREREFSALQQKFKESGRYRGREEEVAARIVNKQRKLYGETKRAKENDLTGKSPDRGLPIEDYQHLTIPQITARLDGLAQRDLKKLRAYELKHKARKGMLQQFDKRLQRH